mmetsp:Transcript_10959/g.15087  ORF Transcript_10959/g.15087 Transcript_10959/m.15087 type:complete len:448 (+) Transcript_10959:3-1346(+)
MILPRYNNSKNKPRKSHGNDSSCFRCCFVFLLFVISALVFLFEFDLEAHYGHGNRENVAEIAPKFSISSTEQEKEVSNSVLSSNKYAYVTLISGIDRSLKYRGFLYNALIIKRALNQLGSSADFITMIGYNDIADKELFKEDIKLLESNGIIIFNLPRLLDNSIKLSFAEMALLKITPWSFTQYERIQYIDGDVMPTRNMDCFFQLNLNTFTIGAVSPLNSGWFLAIPNMEDYDYLKEKAIWRLGKDWDTELGWQEKMPVGFYYRGGQKMCEKWLFNGADMDQGLLFHRFVLNKGVAALVDTELNRVTHFVKGFHSDSAVVSVPASEALSTCDGQVPTRFFAHFTGQKKPWMIDLKQLDPNKMGNRELLQWAAHLDALQLDINSSNIFAKKLGSPLGFFNANFPKGGYKVKDGSSSDGKDHKENNNHNEIKNQKKNNKRKTKKDSQI